MIITVFIILNKNILNILSLITVSVTYKKNKIKNDEIKVKVK